MPDTTPLSIAEQLARYGDSVEAAYGPSERRHSVNGGPVSVIDLRPGYGRRVPPPRDVIATDPESSTAPKRRSRLLLFAAVVVVLAVSAVLLASLLNEPDNLVTDDIEPTTTTTDDITTTSTTPEPEPEALIDADAATIPPELRALSTSSDWLPVSVSLVRMSDGAVEAPGDEHFAAEAAAFHTTDPAVLYLWIIERGSALTSGDAASIDAAVPWGDGLHSGLSWVEGDERYLFQASALDDRRQAPTGSALKDMARSMSPGPDGWNLPGAELVARDRNDGLNAGTSGGSDYAQITWAPTIDGELDLSRQVSQTTRRGDLTDMISELHEASSLGPVRLLPAADGTIRFVMDQGETQRYGLAFVGSTVVNWQGPGGPALDRLITDSAIVDDEAWNRAWVDAADFVQRWVAEEGDSTPALRLAPDDTWEPISAVDPSLWSPMEQFENRTRWGASASDRRRWVGWFRTTGPSSPLPDVVVSVESSDGSAPLYLCEGSWVATTLGSEACASKEPGHVSGPGSRFFVSGNGWYVNLASPHLSLDELASFSNNLEPRGDVVNGFDHVGTGYRLTFESTDPEHRGEMVTSTWRREGLELSLVMSDVDRASFTDWMVQGAALGYVRSLDENRYLITWPDLMRISWYDEEAGYEASVGWIVDPEDPLGDTRMIDAATEMIDSLNVIDRDNWRSLIGPVNEPYVDLYSDFFVDVDGDEVEVQVDD